MFSLVRQPCQKHLVYKLAAASRLLRAVGSGLRRLPPAPGARPHSRGQLAPPWPLTLTWTGVTARGGRPASQQGLLLSAQHRAYPEGQGQRAEPWGDGPRATHRLQPPLPRLPAGLPLRQGKSPVTGPGRPGPGGRAGHAQLLFQHMVAVGPGRCSASAPELCGLSCAPTRLAGCSLGSTRPLPHWYTSPNGELTPAAAPPASSQEFVSRASSARGELVPPHPRGPLSELWGRDRGCFQRMALVGGGLQ